jgi:hypothetical protein
VIQSAAEGIGQSDLRLEDFDGVPDFAALDVPGADSPVAAGAGADGPDASSDEDDPESDPDPDAPDSPWDEPASDDPSSPPWDVADLTAARRSFFAQPVPL